MSVSVVLSVTEWALICTGAKLQVQQLPGVSGLHVMPLTKAARNLAKDLLA